VDLLNIQSPTNSSSDIPYTTLGMEGSNVV